MMVEDAPKSRSAVRDASPHFDVFPEFQGASYLKRYDVLCQRLIQEQLYSTAAVLTSKRDAGKNGDFGEMSSMANLNAFVSAIAGHIATEAART